ncbi:MAG: hypothetical protein LBK82_03865, partial [Planctomycetaceae bacterium]|nr:hypothetical protein [Planctomycetaceae bacterium]
VHSRLSPTRPFSERSPTYKRLSTAGRSRRLSLHFAVINLVQSRLSPTRLFSERSPTYKRLLTYGVTLLSR